MEKLRFNIKGAYGESNFGDDLLMKVFEDYFKKEFPQVELNFEGENVRYPKNILTKASYNKKSDYHWLVYGGGTQFFAFNSSNKLSLNEKLRIGIRNPKLVLSKLSNLIRSKKKQASDCKTAFLGFGLGPFSDNVNAIENAKGSLKTAEFIGVRDEVSYEYCKEWGLDAVLGADVVFSSYFGNSLNVSESSRESKKKIGVIVRDWEFEESGKAYCSKIKEFIAGKEDVDFKIVILAPLRDKTWVRETRSENVIIWEPDKHTIDDFLFTLNDFDAFISARYHGAIIGALLKKPVICIEIEPKLRILSEQIKQYGLWEKPFDLIQLESLVTNLNYDIDYSVALSEYRKKADMMLNEFKSFCND